MSKNWNDENTAKLQAAVEGNTEITRETAEQLCSQFEVNLRSLVGKLRRFGVTVAAATRKVAFTENQEAKLRTLVENNPGVYTYTELAEKVLKDPTKARTVQGKLLSMELTGLVKPTPKVEVAKEYTPEQEAQVLAGMKSGAFIEDIAAQVGKPVQSVRGKALSLLKANPGTKIPASRDKAPAKVDPLEALGDVSGLTVAQIAEKLGKTERGVKQMLTRRHLNAADHKGDKPAKAAAKAE